MNILFILSHPDDEAFGPAGTIAKLSKKHEVHLISLCKGNRPKLEEVEFSRKDSFRKSCEILGSSHKIFDSSDLYLDYHIALKNIEDTIEYINPSIVYTNNISDVHRDHRITAEATLSACRPKLGSKIEELYMYEIPSSTDWAFHQFNPDFIPNVYEDIEPYMNLKKEVINLYDTEVYNFPDSRSLEAVEILAKNRGRQVGFNYAESFKLVFSKR
jgi:LmbE family N-acetylglucosaminyl deacetylase